MADVDDPSGRFHIAYFSMAAFIQSARRKCLILYYYYFRDRDFGLIHVRLQTWFPLQLQVHVPGYLDAYPVVIGRKGSTLMCRTRRNGQNGSPTQRRACCATHCRSGWAPHAS